MTKGLFATHAIEAMPHIDAGEPVEGSGTGEITLKRVLTARHLIMLGIGAVIGAGISSSPARPPRSSSAPPW